MVRVLKLSSAAMGSTRFSRSSAICSVVIPRPNRKKSKATFSGIWLCCTISAPLTLCDGPLLLVTGFMTDPISHPLALIAELTHRCPLHCVYCSNPLELQIRAEELSTDVWARVFQEAAQAGVLQADLTGGEPLTRPDIVDLVRAARAAGLYVSLITSGLPLDQARLGQLVAAGLDHLQLSFQGAREASANSISGTKAHAHKLRVLEWLGKVG